MTSKEATTPPLRRSSRKRTHTSFYHSQQQNEENGNEQKWVRKKAVRPRHIKNEEIDVKNTQLKTDANTNVGRPMKDENDEAAASTKRNNSQKAVQKRNTKKIKQEEGGEEETPPKTKKKKKATDTTKNKLSSPRQKRSPSSSPSKQKKQKISLYSKDLETISPQNKWIDLHISPQELRPSATLTTGQCFHWIAVEIDDDKKNEQDQSPSSSTTTATSAWGKHDAKEWVGTIIINDNHNDGKTATPAPTSIVLSIREMPSTTLYRILHPSSSSYSENKMKEFLHHYFQLNVNLEELYKEWSLADERRLKRIAQVLPGVRIIRQNPVECLFSFICSSNNNIPRITKILSSFRETYGDFLIDLPARIEDENGNEKATTLSLYSFPTLTKLQNSATEDQLRSIGLGYRAKYIMETIKILSAKKEEYGGGENYLYSLRSTKNNASYVQEELIKLSGVGRKVADCIALFSLDQCSAIPVDVHVQHIASRDYDSTLFDDSSNGGVKSLTPTIYKRVGDLFCNRFGLYAGWAHSLLFVAELPSFRPVLPKDILVEMDEWREKEMAKKAEQKKAKKKK